MNNTLRTLGASGALLLFLTTGALSAKPDRSGPRMDPEKRLEYMKKNLDLSAEQTEKIRAIMAKYDPKREALFNKLQPLRKELFELMSQESPDRNAVKSKMQEMSDIKIELRLLMLDGRTETFQVLNAEQKAKWKEQMKKFAKKRGNRDRD
ncbi:MAG: Spy/CpxP family protein refolding chaperone [Leptospiraceae bacterium]